MVCIVDARSISKEEYLAAKSALAMASVWDRMRGHELKWKCTPVDRKAGNSYGEHIKGHARYANEYEEVVAIESSSDRHPAIDSALIIKREAFLWLCTALWNFVRSIRARMYARTNLRKPIEWLDESDV